MLFLRAFYCRVPDMKKTEPNPNVAPFPRKGVVAIIDPRKNTTVFATITLVPSTLGISGPYRLSGSDRTNSIE